MGQSTLLVEIDIHEGETEGFCAAVPSLVASFQANEPGVLRYDFYISDDGRRGWNVEVCEDSEEVIAHMEDVRNRLPELLETAAFTRIEVLGDIAPAGLTNTSVSAVSARSPGVAMVSPLMPTERPSTSTP